MRITWSACLNANVYKANTRHSSFYPRLGVQTMWTINCEWRRQPAAACLRFWNELKTRISHVMWNSKEDGTSAARILCCGLLWERHHVYHTMYGSFIMWMWMLLPEILICFKRNILNHPPQHYTASMLRACLRWGGLGWNRVSVYVCLCVCCVFWDERTRAPERRVHIITFN